MRPILFYIERGHCSGHKQYTGGVYFLLIVVAANLYIYIYIVYLYYIYIYYIYNYIESGHCSGHKQYTGGVYSLLIVVATNLYISIYIYHIYLYITYIYIIYIIILKGDTVVATNSTREGCTPCYVPQGIACKTGGNREL